jgi:hypothetical protein
MRSGRSVPVRPSTVPKEIKVPIFKQVHRRMSPPLVIEPSQRVMQYRFGPASMHVAPGLCEVGNRRGRK